MTILFLIALAGLVATTQYDVSMTDKGIRAGVSVEGNKLIVKLFGPKPTLLQDYVGAALLDSFMLAPAVIGLVFHNVVFFGLGMGAMLGYSARHVRGGLAWKKLLKGK